jgi:two-component system nitrogen regulation sensor histidine kinase GlnL
VLYQNPGAEALFGVSRQQVAGQSATALAPGLDALTELVSRAIREDRSFGRDFTLNPPKQDYRVVELTCRVAPLSTGVKRALIEFVDATQSRQLDRENALINQRVASKRIIRQLAHEVRNPLGGLRGAAQLLERKLDDPGLREYTQVIIGEADRLTALTESLLGPKRQLCIGALNIYEALERVRLLIESDAPPGVAVERDYDPSLPEIAADRDQLIQALLNIARNAMQAIGGEGRLTIRTRALMNFIIGTDSHRLVVSIEFEDDGPGIAADIRDSIFYPLVTDRDGGAGLGLPLAQEIVQRHGGLIEFESEPGRTVFMVRLPVRRSG